MAEAPYGSWRSPVTIGSLTQEVVELRHPLVVGDRTYWVEGRPNEAGRQVIVRMGPDAAPEDVIATPYSARSRVHGTGDSSYAVAGESVFFANFADQRVYRVDGRGDPVAITPAPTEAGGTRYACPFPTAGTVVWVRERHAADGVRNDLVAVPLEGGEPQVLAGGRDFYSAPTVSPDGHRLAWLCWDHPNMPWDGTELYEGVLEGTGVANATLVAGGPNESVSQPRTCPTVGCTSSLTAPAGGTSTPPTGRCPWPSTRRPRSSPGRTGSSVRRPTPSCPTGHWSPRGRTGGSVASVSSSSAARAGVGHLREVRTPFTASDHVRARPGAGCRRRRALPHLAAQIARRVGVPGARGDRGRAARLDARPGVPVGPRPTRVPHRGAGSPPTRCTTRRANPDFARPPTASGRR